MNQEALLKNIEQELRLSHGDLARPYAERILMHVLDCNRTDLYLYGKRSVALSYLNKIQDVTRRCAAHEPLEYILGTTYFFNRFFKVTPKVLIPRPDTESLVEQVLSHEKDTTSFFAEIGVGTGILSCILTEMRPCWSSIGIDISSAAVSLSRENRGSDRMQLVQADVFTAFKSKAVFDFIISNPPYIPTGKLSELDVSVRQFEPHPALDGGSDGLAFYRYFAECAPAVLKTEGRLYCEIGYDQKDAVENIFTNNHWEEVTFHKDNTGNIRVMHARLRHVGETV